MKLLKVTPYPLADYNSTDLLHSLDDLNFVPKAKGTQQNSGPQRRISNGVHVCVPTKPCDLRVASCIGSNSCSNSVIKWQGEPEEGDIAWSTSCRASS